MKKQLLYSIIIALFSQSIIFAQDYCLQFDGVSSRVRYDYDGSLDALNGASDYTIEVWVKPTDAAIHNKVVLRRWGQFSITLFQDANRRVYFTANGATNHYVNSQYNVININEWNHIVVMSNSTDDYTRLYVNGVDVTGAYSDGSPTTAPAYTLNDPGTSANFYIGYGGAGTVPAAYIDKVRIKNIADDLGNLQTSITDPDYTVDANTLALYKINEGTGDITLNEVTSVDANLQCAGGCAEIPTWETVSNTLSFSDNNMIDFSVYPNPVATDFFTIQTNTDEMIQKIELTNVLGKMVKSIELSVSTNVINVNVSDLNSGIYILKTRTSQGMGTKKLVIE